MRSIIQCMRNKTSWQSYRDETHNFQTPCGKLQCIHLNIYRNSRVVVYGDFAQLCALLRAAYNVSLGVCLYLNRGSWGPSFPRPLQLCTFLLWPWHDVTRSEVVTQLAHAGNSIRNTDPLVSWVATKQRYVSFFFYKIASFFIPSNVRDEFVKCTQRATTASLRVVNKAR